VVNNKSLKNKNKCKNCGSGFGYVRGEKKEFVCRQCGTVTELGKKKLGGKK